jgi:hypothetical protein
MSGFYYQDFSLLETCRGILCLVDSIDRVMGVATKLFLDRQDVGKASSQPFPERGGGELP